MKREPERRSPQTTGHLVDRRVPSPVRRMTLRSTQPTPLRREGSTPNPIGKRSAPRLSWKVVVEPLRAASSPAPRPPCEASVEAASFSGFEGIITRDEAMVATLRLVARVADSRASILLCGETGTGKELVARAVHENSARRSAPFVALHCGALPETLLESELFGHVRGAFTGAGQDRTGRIAAANGGTLFLDEVAEIPLAVQAKLLRVVQFGELQRVGADKVERVDVRIVAATHRDLPSRIAESKFREDLYYRLRVVEIGLPPLRERPADVPLLLDHFVLQHWRQASRPQWSRSALDRLLSYRWPGNVRELAHLCERAALLARGPELTEELLPPEIGASSARRVTPAALCFDRFTAEELQTAKARALERVEHEFLTGLLERSGASVSGAARSSGIHRGQLQKMLARSGIRSREP